MSEKKNINLFLMEGRFEEAYAVIEESIKNEKKVDQLMLQHRIIKYWINHAASMEKFKDPYEKGIAFLEEWDSFRDYLEKHNMDKTGEVDAIGYFIHNNAAECFINARIEKNINNIDLLLKIAHCFKEIAKYDEAIEVLQYAYKLNHDAQILLFLADIYYLKGNVSFAKLFFKEVFFFENTINLDFSDISTDKIFSIMDQIRKNGWEEFEILDWIPIYGFIDGFFNIRRELKKEEVERLHLDIIKLEKLFYQDPALKNKIEPIVLKKYIIMVEYFIYQEIDQNKKEQYLNKIKNINPVFYEKLLPFFQ